MSHCNYFASRAALSRCGLTRQLRRSQDYIVIRGLSLGAKYDCYSASLIASIYINLWSSPMIFQMKFNLYSPLSETFQGQSYP